MVDRMLFEGVTDDYVKNLPKRTALAAVWRLSA